MRWPMILSVTLSACAGDGTRGDFSLLDVAPTSPRSGEEVGPSDYREAVSGWYFGHAT